VRWTWRSLDVEERKAGWNIWTLDIAAGQCKADFGELNPQTECNKEKAPQ